MQRNWRSKLAALAGFLLLIAGCATPVLQTDRPGTARLGSVSLFPNPNGLASISMRVIDQRQGYGTQAFHDVEAFDKVRISLTSTRVLKAPREDEFDGHVEKVAYTSPALKNLPPSDDYRLMVALLHNGKVVGQGAVLRIPLEAGQNRPVTVYINTPGEVSFSSDEYHIPVDYGYPAMLAGTSVEMTAYFPWDRKGTEKPRVTHFVYDLYFDSQTVLIASKSQGVGFPVDEDSVIPEGPLQGRTRITLPVLSENDYPEALLEVRIYGLEKDQVIASKESRFFLHRGADLTVDLGDDGFWNAPD